MDDVNKTNDSITTTTPNNINAATITGADTLNANEKLSNKNAKLPQKYAEDIYAAEKILDEKYKKVSNFQ